MVIKIPIRFSVPRLFYQHHEIKADSDSFTEIDFKSKLQADAAFREKARDIEAKKAFSAQEAPKVP